MVKVIVDEELFVFVDVSDALDHVMVWSEAVMIDTKEKIVYFYNIDGALFYQENL